MKENKKRLNKVKVSIVLLIVIILITMSVFGRYIYNSLRDMYLSSRNFYFTSNLLEVNEVTYNFNNWDGQDPYEIKFDLYSYIDELQKVDYDLSYNLTCVVSDETKENAKCTINSSAGPTTINDAIYKANDNKAEITLYVTPLKTLAVGDKVQITITAKTENPYQKQISAKYNIEVSEELSNYKIIDQSGQNYLTLQLINKESTASTVTLTINPAQLRLDMNDAVYSIITSQDTSTIGEGEDEYINEITFSMEAESSRNIRFYKVNSLQDYTYPNAGNTSIIGVTAE